MGQQITRSVAGPGTASPGGAEAVVYDTTWAGEARSAAGCSAVLLCLLLAVDAMAGNLDLARGGLWCLLAALLFVVLWPTRVSAGPGRLVARGLLRRTEVRTDRLVSVRWSDGVAQRLVLRDTEGNRVEIDPRVLVANPPLWHLVGRDARTSRDRNVLRCGETALRQLAARVDGETARTVCKVSGLH
ncbi:MULTISPECIES: hypothetical protein [Streptomyces]|uniref:Integral membrane protein n=1 Tax=Streptomyces xanthochromogenes TaxID=67384 RepID=A0ABQ2ZLZ3_9ACTN|nr:MULTISPECIES: hypothetical protein [Streptomyces]MYV94939.1 hypothetical protein [Streptomyces sp. SID1034]GGY19844.1 hypothetical protein GCM10010326_11170 [Streptomyces xanthochromogenes]